MRRNRTKIAASTMIAGALTLTGCGYEGLNSYTLPGTKGTGNGSIEIKAEFRNMGGLVQNQPVLVNDINVGTITDIELKDWKPVATMKVKGDVFLPANATATIGQTSLLGAKHIALSSPKNEPPQGRLEDGALITLARTRNAPETEDVLASVSLLLNGGGLQHIDTIARELNRSMNGRAEDWTALFTELNAFIGGLNDQKGDIIGAIESLNRLADNLNNGMPDIQKALNVAPQALDVLVEEHEEITQFFVDWTPGGVKSWDPNTGNVKRITNDLDKILQGLEPFLIGLADSGESVVESLRILTGVIFPLDGVGASFHGDQPMFSQAVVDLTLPMIDKNFLTGTPFQGALTDATKFLQLFSVQSGNPLTAPISGGGVPLSELAETPSELLGGLLPSLEGGN